MSSIRQSWASVGSNNVITLDSSPRVLVNEPRRKWREEVTAKLNELTSLTQGWDGYRAPAVSFDTAYFALQILEGVCPTDSNLPQIVPGVGGDLQMEWHTEHGDVELHVRRPYSVMGWFMDETTEPEGIELHFSNDFTLVAEWVRKLMEPIIADAAAA